MKLHAFKEMYAGHQVLAVVFTNSVGTRVGKLIRPIHPAYNLTHDASWPVFQNFIDNVKNNVACKWHMQNGLASKPSFYFGYTVSPNNISGYIYMGISDPSHTFPCRKIKNGTRIVMRDMWDELIANGFRPNMDYFK